MRSGGKDAFPNHGGLEPFASSFHACVHVRLARTRALAFPAFLLEPGPSSRPGVRSRDARARHTAAYKNMTLRRREARESRGAAGGDARGAVAGGGARAQGAKVLCRTSNAVMGRGRLGKRTRSAPP